MRTEHPGPAGYAAAVQRELPGAGVIVNHEGLAISLPCRLCGPMPVFNARNRVHPNKIVIAIRREGWTIGKSAAKHVCPNHKGEPKMPETKSPPVKLAAVESSPDSRAAKREALEWLAESFKDGRYSEGMSDAKISQLTNLSEAAVAGLREEFHGPLREPSEIEALRAEITALEERRVAVNVQHADAMNALTDDIAKLNRRIDTLATKNGWKA